MIKARKWRLFCQTPKSYPYIIFNPKIPFKTWEEMVIQIYVWWVFRIWNTLMIPGFKKNSSRFGSGFIKKPCWIRIRFLPVLKTRVVDPKSSFRDSEKKEKHCSWSLSGTSLEFESNPDPIGNMIWFGNPNPAPTMKEIHIQAPKMITILIWVLTITGIRIRSLWMIGIDVYPNPNPKPDRDANPDPLHRWERKGMVQRTWNCCVSNFATTTTKNSRQ